MGVLDRFFRRRSDRPDRQRFVDGLKEFINARTWAASLRILEHHPELLSEEADALLERLAEAQENAQARRVVDEHRALLRRCREVGVDAAFGENDPSPGGRQGGARDEGLSIPLPFDADLRRAQEAEQRYLRSADPRTLDEAVAAWERILRHSGFAALELNFRLAALNDSGGTYLRRYWARGHIEDLSRALELWQQAIEQTPPGSPDLPGFLSNLGIGLWGRYLRTGELADLERAIGAHEQAVEQTAPGSPDLPACLTNLGVALRDRYARTGELADLERAIGAHEQAVEQTPPGSPDLAARLSNLGVALRDRYARTGELADLERAIQVHEQAVEQTPPGSPDVPGYLSNLGLGLRERYARTREPADLERAIQAFEQAVEQDPPGSPKLPGHLNNLGLGLRDRYARMEEMADLQRAIQAHEQAVEQTPPGSLDLPGYLSNLGVGLKERYARTGELADLERAIRAYEQAVEVTPLGSPDLPGQLNNLGFGLSERHVRTGELADLERAIQAYEQAVELTSPVSPHLLHRLSNLGLALRDRYTRTGELIHLDAALARWERAWSLLQTTFVRAPVAYKVGQQRQWTSLFAGLAAAHLQRAEAKLPEALAARRRAIEVAEGSKSRLLTELLGRGDLPTPSAIPAREAARERELLRTLTSLDTAELETQGRRATPQEEAGHLEHLQQRELCRQELERLWKAMAKSSPEAADYVALRRGDPPDWDNLAGLAADLGSETALLSLFMTAERTLLFVLRQGWEEPAVVDTDLDGRAWADLARRFFREVHGYDSTDRRGDTWDRPVRPLLQRAAAHLAGVERIILAPQAFGHLLPWSVVAWRAGLRGPDELPLLLVTLPALGLLPRLRHRPAGRGAGALVVGNPLKGDPHHALRYAEAEAREVAKMLGTKPLIGPQATKKAVLKRLSDASVVHLATHAYFAPGSPLDSGIVLADGVLTAREVMSHRLKADLLVLSACQTGMAGVLGGDELAGLAQAFLQAGARSLVASLWSVNDPATAALMSAFYATRQEGADKAVALSRAMAQVREGWPHPYYWGAFVLMGDWA